MVEFLTPLLGAFGGVGAVLLLFLGAWRWRVEIQLKEREVLALERQACALEKWRR